MTDEYAMIAVKAGDLDKAAVLYERYKKPLFNFFLYHRYDRDQASDAVQQVFYRLLRYRESFKADAVFRTWLYCIARNSMRDQFRNFVPVDALEAAHLVADEQNDEAHHQQQTVRRALDSLTEDHREVLILSRYEEMKYDQIAEILGCSVAAVKVRVHRAIHKLREAYFQIADQ